MKARLALAACALLSACAVMQPAPKEKPLGPGEVASARAAVAAIAIGKSTKAQVRAAIGQATEIPFDSGYEVWVYRERLKEEKQRQEKQAPPPTELVLLFAPSGVLAKTRVR